jgi:hypothetical protein
MAPPVKGNEKRRRKIGGRDDECFEMSCWPIKEKIKRSGWLY